MLREISASAMRSVSQRRSSSGKTKNAVFAFKPLVSEAEVERIR